MIFKALTYILLTPIRPHFYFEAIKKTENNSRLANTSIIISILLVISFIFSDKYNKEFSFELVVWFLGFFFGFVGNILLEIYLISMLIAKMKNKIISFIDAKLIISFSLLPIIILYFLKNFFPYTELVDFYDYIFILWYAILIIRGMIHLYSIKIIQALIIVFNIIIIKFIFLYTFSARIL